MSSLVVNVSAQKKTGKELVGEHLKKFGDSLRCLVSGDMDCFVENIVAAIPLLAGFLIIFVTIYFFGRNMVFKGENGNKPAVAFGVGVALLAMWQGSVMGILIWISGGFLILIFVFIIIIGILWVRKMHREAAATPDEIREGGEKKKARQEVKRSTAVEKKETDLEKQLLGREKKGFNKLLKLTEKDLKNIEKVHKYLETLKKNIGYLYQIRDEPKSVQLKEQVLKQIQALTPYVTAGPLAEAERQRILGKIRALNHKELNLSVRESTLARNIRQKAETLGFAAASSPTNLKQSQKLAARLKAIEREKTAYDMKLVAFENEIKDLVKEMEDKLVDVKNSLYNNDFPQAEHDIDELLAINRRYWTLEDDSLKIEKWMKDIEKYEFALLNKQRNGILHKFKFK